MSPKRYFHNDLPEHGPQGVSRLDEAHYKSYILDMAFQCGKRQSLTNPKAFDGGVYVGNAGIAYMFYHLSKAPILKSEKGTLLNNAIERIKACIENEERSHEPPTSEASFLLGRAGVYALATVIYNETGDVKRSQACLKKFLAGAEICTPINYVSYGGDELFNGRAGYLCAAKWMEKELGASVVSENITKALCSSILESGKKYSETFRCPFPLMYQYYNTEYLGAAHGLSSILQMLISFPKFAMDSKVNELLKKSVDVLLSFQTPNGNFPCAMDEVGPNSRPEQDELVHWCHGAPGIIYLMAKAYVFWKDRKYLESCLLSGEVIWQKGLLKKGPGICHGVAGNGYAFLLLYRLTQDPKHLHRAIEFAKFMETPKFREARTPDHPFSLFEGRAGTACFLADLFEPQNASFPFFDIF